VVEWVAWAEWEICTKNQEINRVKKRLGKPSKPFFYSPSFSL